MRRVQLAWTLRQFFSRFLKRFLPTGWGVRNRGLYHALKGSRKAAEYSSQSSIPRACLSCVLPFSYSSGRWKAWADRWEAIRAWSKLALVSAHAVRAAESGRNHSLNGSHSLSAPDWQLWDQVWFPHSRLAPSSQWWYPSDMTVFSISREELPQLTQSHLPSEAVEQFKRCPVGHEV